MAAECELQRVVVKPWVRKTGDELSVLTRPREGPQRHLQIDLLPPIDQVVGTVALHVLH